MSGVHCYVCAASKSGCTFVYFIVQYCIEYRNRVSLFQSQDVQGKCKSSEVAGTTVLFKVLYYKIKMFFLIFMFVFLM